MELLDYQSKGLADVSAAWQGGARRVLYVLPTGGGKTLMAAESARRTLARGKKVLIVLPWLELLAQTGRALRSVGITDWRELRSGASNPEPDESLVVASMPTLVRRREKLRGFLASRDLVYVDEAHHAVADTWLSVLAETQRAFVLGMTATPCRQDGRGLGRLFDGLVQGPGYSALQGRMLVESDIYAPTVPKLDGVRVGRTGEYDQEELERVMGRAVVFGDVLDAYYRFGGGEKAIAFCQSRGHARSVSDQMAQAGLQAWYLDGAMRMRERDEVVRRFGERDSGVLVTCDVVSEGFDCPSASVGIFLRATRSLRVWIQQAGRLVRASPGKERATLIDHCGNTLRLGPPDEDREWELDDGWKGARKAQTQAVQVCKECMRVWMGGAAVCPYCGVVRQAEPRPINEDPKKDLEKVDREALKRARRREVARCRTQDDLAELGRRRGYQWPNAWARRVMEGRRRKREYAS